MRRNQIRPMRPHVPLNYLHRRALAFYLKERVLTLDAVMGRLPGFKWWLIPQSDVVSKLGPNGSVPSIIEEQPWRSMLELMSR
jgi:hypothetical protein